MTVKEFNRWNVVLGALLIQVSLGAIFIYSVYKPFLKENFPLWDNTDLALPSQIVLLMFAVSMILSGRLQDKFGPRLMTTIGGILLGSGLVIASLAKNLTIFVLGYSILGGLGIGAAYVCPIATCVKWFPDKRGLITGLAVAGFGAGGLVFTPVAKILISNFGIMNTFLILGIIFFLAIIFGAQFMRPAPLNYKPRNWNPTTHESKITSKYEYTSVEMIRTYQFWFLWFAYFSGCTAGLLIIMNVMNLWQSFAILNTPFTASIIHKDSFSEIISRGAEAIIIVSILNASGRIIWGKISDIIGRKNTLMIMFLYCALIMFSLNSFGTYILFIFGVASVGFCFGGYLAQFPAITADYFGVKNIGANYGWMYTAYGAGGLLGPYIAPKLMKVIQNVQYEAVEKTGTITLSNYEAGSYLVSFIIAGSMCVIAAILVGISKNPKKTSY
jgi:OFA family oxalate/formate antiporter-like MFS transporter